MLWCSWVGEIANGLGRRDLVLPGHRRMEVLITENDGDLEV